MRRRRAAFLDRDGTLTHDVGYPRDPAAVRLLDGAAEALARLKGYGFALVVVSNQSGVGRGLVTPDEARRVHDAVAAALAERGVRPDAWYYCPHAPEDGCACRKPSPGMLLRAARELNLSLPGSFLIGDKASDVQAGRRAGCATILLNGGAYARQNPPPFCRAAADWRQALMVMEARLQARR